MNAASLPGNMLLFAKEKVGFLTLLHLNMLENMCSVVCRSFQG